MAIKWNRYRYFSTSDFPPAKGEPAQKLLEMLDEAREEAGVPFIITSGVRKPKKNQKAGGADDSAHMRGLAVDISIPNSHARYKILRGLILVGFHRLGIYDLHIHADCDESLDPEVAWHGISKRST